MPNTGYTNLVEKQLLAGMCLNSSQGSTLCEVPGTTFAWSNCHRATANHDKNRRKDLLDVTSFGIKGSLICTYVVPAAAEYLSRRNRASARIEPRHHRGHKINRN
jgi:hypothetical protein